MQDLWNSELPLFRSNWPIPIGVDLRSFRRLSVDVPDDRVSARPVNARPHSSRKVHSARGKGDLKFGKRLLLRAERRWPLTLEPFGSSAGRLRRPASSPLFSSETLTRPPTAHVDLYRHRSLRRRFLRSPPLTPTTAVAAGMGGGRDRRWL
jgi:hypothetical protein